MTRQARSMRCPDSVLGWIPWYGETDEDGVHLLDARQRGAVEAHASECADCRAELDMIAGAPWEIDVDLPDPDRVFMEIAERIDAGEAAGLDTSPSLPAPDAAAPPAGSAAPDGRRPLAAEELDRLAAWVLDESSEAELLDAETDADAAGGARVIRGPWLARPVRAALAAAAVFALGLLGGGFLAGNGLDALRGDATVYTSAAAAGVTEAGLIDVVFADGVTAARLSERLRELGVEVVSGPSSVGRFRVRVKPAAGESGPASADLAAIAARLKAGDAPLALFAEPVLP